MKKGFLVLNFHTEAKKKILGPKLSHGSVKKGFLVLHFHTETLKEYFGRQMATSRRSIFIY